MDERIDKLVRITLDGTGAGSATLGPGRQSEQWDVTRYTTSGASTVEPNLDVCRGSANIVDTTRRGNGDVSETDLHLYGGEFMTVRYTGGTIGAVMTFYLEGTRTYGDAT